MNKAKDILGESLKGFLKHQKGVVKVHCSHTEPDTVPLEYFFRSYDQMPKLEQKALNLCFGHVLDVGAGAGSHALYLQEQGFQITALEVSQGACEVMKQRGLSQVVNANILDYANSKYDTLLLLMNGIGIAENLDKLPTYLNHLKSLLNPNGQILFDSSDLSYLYQNDDGSYWVDLNAQYHGELTYQWEYRNEKGDEFDWLFIDEQKISEIAKQCGLEFEQVARGDNYDYLGKLTHIA